MQPSMNALLLKRMLVASFQQKTDSAAVLYVFSYIDKSQKRNDVAKGCVHLPNSGIVKLVATQAYVLFYILITHVTK